MLDRPRHLFLGWWSRLVSRRPGWVLFIAAAIAVASVAVAYANLHFESNRNALIDDDLLWNERFIQWREQFPNTDDLVVAVDTYQDGEPSAEAAREAEALVDELGERLRESEHVLDVIWGFAPQAASPRAFRVAPMAEFERRAEQMAQAELVLQSETPGALLQRAMAQMRGDRPGAAEATAQLARFTRMIDAFTARMGAPADELFDLAERIEGETGADGWRYLRTDNGRMLLLRVTPREDPDALNPYRGAIAGIRDVLADARQAHPDVAFGLTGIKVIEADETAAATFDSMIASIVAAVLIAVLLVTAFQSFRIPLMLMVALAIGIAWSFGVLTLMIGHLQVISVVFVVLLLGLGVAFGIHLASGFELLRFGHTDDTAGFSHTLQQTLESIGPGLLTGALTTAAAFMTTLFTDFRGVAEMGAIAAAGVLLCLIAMCSVYPALLRLIKPRHKHFKQMQTRRLHLFESRWVMPFVRRPRTTLAVAAIIVCMSLGAITQMRFNYNLMALMPRGVDSVEWQRRIVEQGEQSIWSATSVVRSVDAAAERAAQLRALPTVESVGGIGLLSPAHGDERRARLDVLRDTLQHDVQQALRGQTPASTEATLPGQVDTLRSLLPMARTMAPADMQAGLDELSQSLNGFAATTNALSDEQRNARLAALHRDYRQWRQNVAKRIDAALAPVPGPALVKLDDLPTRLLKPYIGRADNGAPRFAIEVYPKLPAGIDDPLDPRFLGTFIRDVYRVDPAATGVVVQVYESGALIWRSYMWAGLYAMLAVLLIVGVDFQSFRDAFLALAPVAAGFAVTFAVMFVANVQINPANIIVLPLMFGIGIDAGVHILHRYRQSPRDRPPGLTAGTGKGITLTSLTTMIGFGAMMLASHRGIASLGFVLCVGIGLTLLACWTIMPAWLEWRNQRQVVQSPEPATATQEPVKVEG